MVYRLYKETLAKGLDCSEGACWMVHFDCLGIACKLSQPQTPYFRRCDLADRQLFDGG